MNAQLNLWLAQLLATDAPALPTALAMQIWLHLGWSVVLASMGAGVVSRYWPGTAGRLELRHWGTALVLALWTWVPGPYSPAYWLGLVFQAPSIVAVLLCDGLLRKRFLASRSAPAAVHEPNRFRLSLALAGVLVGWALLLDTFALLPMQLYAWGFSPVAVALVVFGALLPWLAALDRPSQSLSSPTRQLPHNCKTSRLATGMLLWLFPASTCSVMQTFC